MRVRLSMFSVSSATFIRSYYQPVLKILLFGDGGGGGGGGAGAYSLIWPIRGCTAGRDVVFVLSVLNRVFDFVPVCLKQGV